MEHSKQAAAARVFCFVFSSQPLLLPSLSCSSAFSSPLLVIRSSLRVRQSQRGIAKLILIPKKKENREREARKAVIFFLSSTSPSSSHPPPPTLIPYHRSSTTTSRGAPTTTTASAAPRCTTRALSLSSSHPTLDRAFVLSSLPLSLRNARRRLRARGADQGAVERVGAGDEGGEQGQREQ